MRLQLDKKTFFTRGGLLDKILDETFDQALMVDKYNKVIYFSSASQQFTKINPEDIIGKKFDDFVPNTGFKKVLKTGIADNGTLTFFDGNVAIANHIPVFDDKELIGAIGIVYFNNISTLKKLLKELGGNSLTQDLYHTISRHSSSYNFSDYIGESKVVKNLIKTAKNASESNLPVLLIGETGTGKEILANAIHNQNKKTFLNPFVKLNCSAIPESLLESELFGHEKGAFTGASSTKNGKFETAANGSILLDEIGDMDIGLQAKLLRVLEENEFERVGGNKLIPANARVIASTNVNIPTLLSNKKFREDLYYRLNTLEIHVPPLRDRLEDIPVLVDHFITNNNYDIRFNESAQEALFKYSWPGNVRQLRNLIDRFGVLKPGEIIKSTEIEEFLPSSTKRYNKSIEPTHASLSEKFNGFTLENIEREVMSETLKKCKGNQSMAASLLAISRSTMVRKIRKYNIVYEDLSNVSIE